MKTLFCLSLSIAVFSGALLLWWEVSDGVRFDRVKQDLSMLSPDDLAEAEANDPWGNSYARVRLPAEGRGFGYLYSKGPDGDSGTFGNDPDDIAIWTTRSQWLGSQYPTSPVVLSFALAGILTMGSTTFLVIRRRKGESKNRMLP